MKTKVLISSVVTVLLFLHIQKEGFLMMWLKCLKICIGSMLKTQYLKMPMQYTGILTDLLCSFLIFSQNRESGFSLDE